MANAIETPNAAITTAAMLGPTARDVVGHRVQRDRGRQVVPLDERRQQRLLGGKGERREDAEREREAEHDLFGREPAEGERGESRCQHRLGSLSREEKPAPVEAVGGGARPGREEQDRPELRELEHSEEESRVREAVEQNG